MLTIGQLASYAGVTIRAVRHYHAVGLLPEPQRDASGYRRYDAAAVLRLIRIRTLAEAGVPLARVHELLDADAQTFAAATAVIDGELRRQVRELQEHRRRIARLASGDSLAVPQEVLDYLDLVRATGAPEAMVRAERDAWILVAARWPERIPAFMVDKTAQLADPQVVRLYGLIGRLLEVDGEAQDEVVEEVADVMVALYEQAAASGHLDEQDQQLDDADFVGLLDALAGDAHPAVPRLQEAIARRGWTGWSRVERTACAPDR